jgi:hypothetical protein
MLKNSDIKVNNFIATGKEYNHSTSIIGKVLSIGNDDQAFEQVYCECEEAFEWFFKDSYCGIPITFDILVDHCGFSKPIIGSIKRVKMTFSKWESIELSENNDAPGLWYLSFRQGDYEELNELHKNDFVFLRRDIKYIHELQNIYFFLTGMELDINLLSYNSNVE